MTQNPVLTLTPAIEFPTGKLVQTINRAYSDYYVSIWFDEAQFLRQCQEEDTNLHHSVLAQIDDEIAGMVLLAHREKHGWINAVGVLPTWRRHGIARQMLLKIQETARTLELESLTLEVLTQNEGALALYRNLGFTCQRELLVLTSEAVSSLSPLPPGIASTSPAPLLSVGDLFHDVSQPWQRERATLQHRLPELQALAYQENGHLCGYLLYQTQRQYLSIQDLAVIKEHPRRVDLAHLLLQAMHSQHPGAGGYAINIPADDPLLPAYFGLPYKVWQRQYEMVWKVNL